MKYRNIPGLSLSDHTDPRLTAPSLMVSVPASIHHRKIAAFFQSANAWEDFVGSSDPAAIEAFKELCAAGLIVPDSDAPKHEAATEPAGLTMFDAPARPLQQIMTGEIVFVGAPIDVGTTGFPGARFGPQALRAASVERYTCEFDLETGEMIAWNVPSLGGAILGGARLSDAGDVRYTPGEPLESYYARLRQVVSSIYTAGGIPIVLGGDHSLTYSTVPEGIEAFVQLDAHCDLAELQPGHCHHHGNFLTRLVAERRAAEIHQFGLRDTSGWDTVNAGTFFKSVGDLELDGWSDALVGKEAYISLDVDVLDPTELPGTGTPLVGGLSLRQLCQVLARITAVTKPVGLDIVELCPMRDASGLSERTVIEALLCFLAVFHRTHQN